MLLVPGSALAYEWSQDDATVMEEPVTDTAVIQLYGQYLLSVWKTGNHFAGENEIIYAKAGRVHSPDSWFGHNITWGAEIIVSKSIWYTEPDANFHMMAVSQFGTGSEGLIAVCDYRLGLGAGVAVLVSVRLDTDDLSLELGMNTTVTIGQQPTIDLCKFEDGCLLATYSQSTSGCTLRAIYDNYTVAASAQSFTLAGDMYSVDVTPLNEPGTAVLFSIGDRFRVVKPVSNASGVNMYPISEVPVNYGNWVQKRVRPVSVMPPYSFFVVASVSSILPYPYVNWVGVLAEMDEDNIITFGTVKSLVPSSVFSSTCQSLLLSFDNDDDVPYDELMFIYKNTGAAAYNITITIDPSEPTYGWTNGSATLLSSEFNGPTAYDLGWQSVGDGDTELNPSWSFIACPYAAYPNNDHYIKFITYWGFGDVYDADFVCIPTSGHEDAGIYGLEVTATYTGDMLPNAVYTWDWGDGDTDVIEGVLHCGHWYDEAGVYDVSVEVGSDVGNFTETKLDYITVYPVGSTIYLLQMDWSIYWLFGLVLAFVTIVIMFKRGK